jgi:hypothetical protein
MTEALQEIREGFSSKQIKMAIGVASDKRYAGGNMTGAVDAIEKIKKGLSDHPQVAAVLKRQNEDLEEELELTEAKISKELAIKILSMRKDKKFVKVSGDFVPKIYLSGNDKDALKKEFGKLPRGLPSATSGMSVVSMINYALGSKDGRDPIDTEDGDSQSPKLISWNKGGKVIGKPRTVGDAVKIAGVRMESVESAELDEGKMKDRLMKAQDLMGPSKNREQGIEFVMKGLKVSEKEATKLVDAVLDMVMNNEVEIDEMKMNDPKLNKIFDKLKKGDTVKLKTSSTINQGKDFVEYIVKSKNTVNKGRVEKITLVTKGNEKAVKKFLYKRDGQVTFAIGDMGASIDDIKEGFFSKEYEPGQYKNGDEKPFVDAIKKAGGKNIEVEKPTRRDPMLTIEFDGDAKKAQKEVDRVGDGTEEIDEAVKYQFVAIDRLGKVIGFASDERDAKDMATRGHTMDSPSKGKGVAGRNKAKVVKLKKPMSDKQGDMMINRDFDMNKFGGETTYSIGLKEEDDEKKMDKPDSAKEVDQARDDKKKTRIAQLQLQIAKATETINKLNTQEKPNA